MNAEKLLEWSIAALGHIENKDYTKAANILEFFKTEAEQEIRTQTAKASGKLSRVRAAERVLKRAMADKREALHGAWFENGKQYICDCFSLFEFFEPLPLPELPSNVLSLDAKRIMDPVKKNNGIVLELPEASELRCYIKTKKAHLKAVGDKSGVIWDFGEGLPLVNAQFLLDVLEILPGCTARLDSMKPCVRAIYFSSPDGCCGLFPVLRRQK